MHGIHRLTRSRVEIWKRDGSGCRPVHSNQPRQRTTVSCDKRQHHLDIFNTWSSLKHLTSYFGLASSRGSRFPTFGCSFRRFVSSLCQPAFLFLLPPNALQSPCQRHARDETAFTVAIDTPPIKTHNSLSYMSASS
ncbi:hypothetical protein AUEXF2481DRAFT_290671 [Aureobasidium subglaciale EXF-2481]|uniref:Uncharacterized protein n=1 Tax=Aureobasidium subglaciale (strain EXF-2481) TaxID=1043005 RepID=A0A074Y8D7_AURSE|nr:uncharacterized protein AUEXF2481DRAFT_290671 [Aureobasidium subglaciale EXF-2481]KEQ94038.1 hypothetical protein AUEXF2481DRAFT_290671 [Aureobasidium subglaciale EXF-2481]